MLKTSKNYANFVTNLHFNNLWESSRAAQARQAGHMRPAGRVFETTVLDPLTPSSKPTDGLAEFASKHVVSLTSCP